MSGGCLAPGSRIRLAVEGNRSRVLSRLLPFVDPACQWERARIVMSTGRIFDAGRQACSINIAGIRGHIKVTFASSTSQSSIIDAINQFKHGTCVIATQDRLDPALVRLTSRYRGPRQFVAARRVRGNLDGILYDDQCANGAHFQFDRGQ